MKLESFRIRSSIPRWPPWCSAMATQSPTTSWSRRPLTEEQMHYAVSDVTHLRDVFAALDADLKKRGRSDWVSEEMEVLTSPKTYDFHPERAWERLKTRDRKST